MPDQERGIEELDHSKEILNMYFNFEMNTDLFVYLFIYSYYYFENRPSLA